MSFCLTGAKVRLFFESANISVPFFYKKEIVVQMKEELCVIEILRFALNDNGLWPK